MKIHKFKSLLDLRNFLRKGDLIKFKECYNCYLDIFLKVDNFFPETKTLILKTICIKGMGSCRKESFHFGPEDLKEIKVLRFKNKMKPKII